MSSIASFMIFCKLSLNTTVFGNEKNINDNELLCLLKTIPVTVGTPFGRSTELVAPSYAHLRVLACHFLRLGLLLVHKTK